MGICVVVFFFLNTARVAAFYEAIFYLPPQDTMFSNIQMKANRARGSAASLRKSVIDM